MSWLMGVALLFQSGAALLSASPAFVQEKDNQVTSGQTSRATFSGATAAGNLIAVYVIWDNTGSASVSDSLGNSYASALPAVHWSSGKYSTQIFYAISQRGGSNAVTATFATKVNSFGIVYAHEYSGISSTAPVDVTAAATGTSGSLNSGSATTTNAADLIFAGGVSATVVTGAGSGFAARSFAQGNISEDRVVSATGSYSATASNSSGAWGMQMVAFKAAASGSDTTAPSVPTGLSVTGTTPTTASLSWTASTDNVGVTGYKINRGGLQVATSPTASFTDSGLSPATAYSYTVSAYDAAGNNSAPSAAVQATTLSAADTTPPSVPTSLRVTGSTSATVSLSWRASTDNVGVTGYKINRGGVQVATSPAASFTDSGLSPSTPYSYTVSAYDAAGNNSAASAAVQATTLSAPDTTPPSVPTGLSVTGTTSTTVSLSWTASTDNVGVSGYRINRGGVLVTTSQTASFTDSGLSPATAYSYTVSAYDAAGNNSAASAAIQATTLSAPDTTPPSVPTGLSVTGTTTTTVSLTWTASTDNVSVAGYKINRAGVQVATSQAASFTDSGLSPSTAYSYTVSAYDAAGNNSAGSAAVQATTLSASDTTPPSVPTGLSVTGTTSTTVSLSWTASTDNVGVSGYKINRSGVQVATSPTASFTDSGLSPSTPYSYTVSAFDAAGNTSSPSSSIPATTAGSLDFSVIHLGIMGDSSSDEYRADDNRGGAYAATTLNWAELLAKYRGIDIGGWGTYPEPRRSGYAYNWARSGAVAADLIGQGQAAGVAGQVTAGQVNTVVIYIGNNDFGSNYSDIYNGVVSGQALQNKISGFVSSVSQAADTVLAAGAVHMIVLTVADPGNTPSVIAGYPDPNKRSLVTNAIRAVNSGITAMAASRAGVVVTDPFDAPLPYPIDASGNMLIGGQTIGLASYGDEPHNGFLSDGHGGTVGEGILANLMFINVVNNVFGATITPFTDQEILNNAGIF